MKTRSLTRMAVMLAILVTFVETPAVAAIPRQPARPLPIRSAQIGPVSPASATAAVGAERRWRVTLRQLLQWLEQSVCMGGSGASELESR